MEWRVLVFLVREFVLLGREPEHEEGRDFWHFREGQSYWQLMCRIAIFLRDVYRKNHSYHMDSN